LLLLKLLLLEVNPWELVEVLKGLGACGGCESLVEGLLLRMVLESGGAGFGGGDIAAPSRPKGLQVRGRGGGVGVSLRLAIGGASAKVLPQLL